MIKHTQEEIMLVIPDYIRHITLSNSQRPIHIEWDGIKLKAGKKNIPTHITGKEYRALAKECNFYKPEWLNDGYRLAYYVKDKFISFVDNQRVYLGSNQFIDSKGHAIFVTYSDGKKVTINEKSVGKPKLKAINGQDLYSGTIDVHLRGKMMQQIKTSFLEHLTDFPVIDESWYPLRISTYIYESTKNAIWDIGNRALPYNKALLDLLRTGKTGTKDKEGEYIRFFEPKLIEDSIKYVTQEGGATFIPISEQELPMLVFKFTKDSRNVIKNSKFYEKIREELSYSLHKRREDNTPMVL